jgi:hypothetical protein
MAAERVKDSRQGSSSGWVIEPWRPTPLRRDRRGVGAGLRHPPLPRRGPPPARMAHTEALADRSRSARPRDPDHRAVPARAREPS